LVGGARPDGPAISGDNSVILAQSKDDDRPGLLLRDCTLRKGGNETGDLKPMDVRLHAGEPSILTMSDPEVMIILGASVEIIQH
jgi:hypothetical protein